MKVRMQAIQGFPYAGKRLHPDDYFEARGESDARLLEAIGRARRATDVHVASRAPRAVVIKPAALATSAVAPDVAAMFPGGADQAQAGQSGEAGEPAEAGAETGADAKGEEQPAASPAPAPAARGKRTYRRRDMTAEGRE